MDYTEFLTKIFEAARPRCDGDLADRLNYCFTTGILIVFALFIAMWEFVGTPIACWFPAYFNGWWEEYALDYCFVQNTYYLPITQGPRGSHEEVIGSRVEIPQNITQREQGLIGYYQWVPLIFTFSAISFFLPITIWRSLNSQYGIQVNTILEIASADDNSVNRDNRDRNMNLVGRFLARGLSVETETVKSKPQKRYRKCHIVMLYLVIKIMYAFNSLFQFWLLGAMLDYKWSYGARVMHDLARGLEWPATGHFPRVTMCDFQVRVLGNLHRHTVQCVLMINMFNEKFFVLLWWWYLILTPINFLAFAKWLYYIVWSKQKYEFITSLEPDTGRREGLLRHFVDEFIYADGIFLLKLVELNAGSVQSRTLLRLVWQEFQSENPDLFKPVPNHNGSNYSMDPSFVEDYPPPKYRESPESSTPLIEMDSDAML